MPILVNLRHLESHEVQLSGEISVEELDLDLRDEIIRAEKPFLNETEFEWRNGS